MIRHHTSAFAIASGRTGLTEWCDAVKYTHITHHTAHGVQCTIIIIICHFQFEKEIFMIQAEIGHYVLEEENEKLNFGKRISKVYLISNAGRMHA